jgi:hypothetical protein
MAPQPTRRNRIKTAISSYCVECCKTGDLLYSSNSKPQAFSFAEGYRARDNGDDTPKTAKTKAEEGNDDKTAKPTQNVDPAY